MSEITVSIKNCEQLIKTIVESNLVPFIWGPPGIGKSSLIKQLFSHEREVIDIRLSIMEPSTLLGVMVPNLNNGESTWLPPAILKINDTHTSRRKVYFFDEINSAPPSLQAAAYQIILDRRIGPHKLPENSYVIAAGNDKGIVYKMPAPLCNRFVHINLAPSIDDFIEYGTKNGIHHLVLSYLMYQKGDLFIYDNNVNKGFPTPRSWEFVSNILHNLDKNKLSDKYSLLLPLINGAIGEATAFKFVSFLKSSDVINVEKILLENQDFKIAKDQIDLSYAFMIACAFTLKNLEEKINTSNKKNKEEDEKKFNELCDAFMKYCLRWVESGDSAINKELLIMGVKYMLSMEINIDLNLPHWDKFFSNSYYTQPIRDAFSSNLNVKLKK